MRQFLQALYGEKLISFDAKTKQFRYDVAAVRERRDHGERGGAARQGAAAFAREHARDAARWRPSSALGSSCACSRACRGSRR